MANIRTAHGPSGWFQLPSSSTSKHLLNPFCLLEATRRRQNGSLSDNSFLTSPGYCETSHRCPTMDVSHMADQDMEDWIQNPCMQRYQPQDSGPMTWAEEQRVYCVLWHLQLFYDIQQPTCAKSKLNWPQIDLQWLLKLDPREFWSFMNCGLLGEQWTVKQYVKNLCQDWSLSWLLMNWGEFCYNWTVLPPLVPKRARKVAHLQYLGHPLPGYFIIAGLPELKWSPVPFVGFPPFRPYGLAIWDRKRPMALELRGVVLERDLS